MDCIPAVRRLVLRAMADLTESDEAFKTTTLAANMQYSTTTVRRALEDLQALGVLTGMKEGQGKADRWHARAEWRPALDTMKTVERLTAARAKATFPEKSEGVSHTHIIDCPHGLDGSLWEAGKLMCGLCLGMPPERIAALRKGGSGAGVRGGEPSDASA
jgi:hypothetical protein